MPYSITCSTKILTLAIAPFLFIFISIICEFTMVSGRYILLSSQKEEVHYSFWGHRCTHSAAYSSKRFKSLLHHIKVVVEMEKNTNKKFSCFMVLILRPSSTLKFQFASGVNECFWEFFSLLFLKNSGFIFELWLFIYDFWFYDTTNFKSPLTHMRMNKKPECKDHQYILRNVEKNL